MTNSSMGLCLYTSSNPGPTTCTYVSLQATYLSLILLCQAGTTLQTTQGTPGTEGGSCLLQLYVPEQIYPGSLS